MSLVNAEAIGSTKNAVVRRQFYFIAYNDLQIGGRFNAANVLLYEVPTYLVECSIGNENRKTKRKKGMAFKLYNTDCTQLITELPKASLVITDPPYPNRAGHFLDGIEAAKKFMAEYKCDHWMIFWCEMETPPIDLPLVAKHIWHRSNTNRPDNYEMIYEFHIDGKKRASRVLPFPVIYPNLTGCFEAVGHPTQKNRKLIARLIEMSKETGLIIDPFFGSNTTGVVCAKYGFDYIGIEKDKKWFDIGKKEMDNEISQCKMF